MTNLNGLNTGGAKEVVLCFQKETNTRVKIECLRCDFSFRAIILRVFLQANGNGNFHFSAVPFTTKHVRV